MSLLEAKKIAKRFPGVLALSAVDFELEHGEIHALVGENGAGKSTLVKILSGVLTPDDGEIFYEGKKVRFSSPNEALRKGIVTVHQELNLFEKLSVAENLFVSDINNAFISKKKLRRQAQDFLSSLGFELDASKPVYELSTSERQLILIAKALKENAKVLILDEPTASIARHETVQLFNILRTLTTKGVSVIFITHRLDEVFEIADRITILRDGKHIVTKKVSEISREEIVRHMVGRAITEMYPKYNLPSKEVILEVEDLTVGKFVSNVSFSVLRGEIFGITGLVGSGASIVPLSLYGAIRAKWKRLTVLGENFRGFRHPTEALKAGIAIVPEERKQYGLFLELDVRKNICIQNLDAVSNGFLISWKKLNSEAARFVEKFSIRTPSLKQLVKNLSGGNQQKVLVSKVLRTSPKILFMVEPTRGIDVGTKVDIYKMINDLAKQGIGVILVSTELPEIVKLCDRVLVMHRGRQAGILAQDEITQENVIRLATGG